MRRGRSKREAIVESLRENLQAVVLTSVTTAIGFLSMNVSDAPPFERALVMPNVKCCSMTPGARMLNITSAS